MDVPLFVGVQDSYGISQDVGLFGREGRTGLSRGYLELRRMQNSAWASDSVRKGVQHASDRNYPMAIKCYQSAIQLVFPPAALPFVLVLAGESSKARTQKAPAYGMFLPCDVEVEAKIFVPRPGVARDSRKTH